MPTKSQTLAELDAAIRRAECAALTLELQRQGTGWCGPAEASVWRHATEKAVADVDRLKAERLRVDLDLPEQRPATPVTRPERGTLSAPAYVVPPVSSAPAIDAIQRMALHLMQHADPVDLLSDDLVVLGLKGKIADCRAINAARVKSALQAHPDATAFVMVDSRGGIVPEADAIADAIAEHQAPTIGIVTGDCMSAANRILLACNRRKSVTDARFLVHQASIGEPDDTRRQTAGWHAEQAARLERVNRDIADVYSKRTGTAPEVFATMLKAESYFGADRAFELGIVHAVIYPAAAFGT